MRGFFLLVEVVETRESLEVVGLVLEAEVTREVVVSIATPAREGRAIVRAARRLGIGSESWLFRCRA